MCDVLENLICKGSKIVLIIKINSILCYLNFFSIFFFLQVQNFGANIVHDLKPNGQHIPVTEETKRQYVKLVCIEKMTNSIRSQIDSFLEGFYEIIPKRLISIFDEQELELLIAGLPTIDIEDLKLNTEYHKYTEASLQVSWMFF